MDLMYYPQNTSTTLNDEEVLNTTMCSATTVGIAHWEEDAATIEEDVPVAPLKPAVLPSLSGCTVPYSLRFRTA